MFKQARLITSCIVLACALFGNYAIAGWEQKTPSTIMGDFTDRYQHRLAFAGDDRIILFGGNDGAYRNDTWVYDLSDNQWQNLSDISNGDTPPARSQQGFCHIGDDKILMFSGTNNQRDTWIYDISQKMWTELAPTYVNGTPYYGYKMGMCYLGDDKALMYSDYNYTNTWVFDLSENSWTKITPTVVNGTLDYRSNMAFSYIGDDNIIMFSGYIAKPNDTWIFDLSDNTWTKMTPVGSSPTARYNAGMAYLGQDKVVLFSGQLQSNDTWIYDLSDNEWTNVTFDTTQTPDARNSMGMCYAGLGKAVMFGGTDGTKMGDTWVYELPGIGMEGLVANVLSGSIDLSWSTPVDTDSVEYMVYKNNRAISDTITIGTQNNGMIDFTFNDDSVASGTLNRYKVLEINTVMNSGTFSEEIIIPYCQ